MQRRADRLHPGESLQISDLRGIRIGLNRCRLRRERLALLRRRQA